MKSGAVVYLAFSPDVTAVSLHNMLHYCQSETCAAVAFGVACASFVYFIESLEDAGYILRRYADTCVLYADQD